MYVTCMNCGKNNIPAGTVKCPSCGRGLPAVTSLTSASSSSSSRPVLVDVRGRQYSLNPSSATLVGSRGCAILLSDPGIPSQAARIVPNGGGFFLEDVCGQVKVNGVQATAPIALQPGDKVSISSTQLIYRGPSTTAIVPPPKPAPPSIFPVISPPLPPSPAVLSSPPVALKSWGADRPLVEGTIEFMDGPHRVEKGNMGGKVAVSLALSLISTSLMMLPFWMKQDITVWYLRIKAYPTGKIVSIVMRGEPGSLPQMGDWIAVWGMEKDGNVLMKRGYNYTTDSAIPLKG